jgi:hypothetical protein
MSACLHPRSLTIRRGGEGHTRVCSCVIRVAAGRSPARCVRARPAIRRRSGRRATTSRSARRSRRSPKPVPGGRKARSRSARALSARLPRPPSSRRRRNGSRPPRPGVIRTRSGDPYKPSALRAYKQMLQHRVLPALGQQRLGAISRNMLQDLADELAAAGLSPSSIRNTILPLRAIYRRAHNRDEIALNPTLKLTLPAVRGQRERVARPDEATALLAALPLPDRAIWATAGGGVAGAEPSPRPRRQAEGPVRSRPLRPCCRARFSGSTEIAG